MSRNSISNTSSSSFKVFVFAIMGKGDLPIYEADLSVNNKKDISEHLAQFIIHQSLDSLDELVWRSPSMFLKTIDSFNNYSVAAYCTPGHMKFLLLYKNKNETTNPSSSNIHIPSDENMKAFFETVHENYIKVLLNPLYEPNGIITSSLFDQNVHLAAKRYLHQ